MVSGLGRRHARAGWLHRHTGVVIAATGPTPYEIFGADLVHEWDLSLSTVTIATGVSSLSDLRGGKNLTQATAANQPAYTGAGLQSYATGDGINDYLAHASMTLLYGDFTFLAVAKANSTAAAQAILGCWSSGHIARAPATPAGNFAFTLQDDSGLDTMTLGAADTNVHAWVARNAVGVSRKFYIDGGAGVAGVRTDALRAGADLGLFARGNGSIPASARLYWVGIVRPSPSLANLNLWGTWADSRFGLSWSTAT